MWCFERTYGLCCQGNLWSYWVVEWIYCMGRWIGLFCSLFYNQCISSLQSVVSTGIFIHFPCRGTHCSFKSSEWTYDPTCYNNPDRCHFIDTHFCLSEYMICFSTRSVWPVKQCPEAEHCGMLHNSITLNLCKIVQKISSWEENNCHIRRTIITGI